MTRIDPPHAWGLPAAFDTWRPVQEEALTFLSQSRKRVKALLIPTGGGKSPVGVADALRSNQPTCYVTESRALQDQSLKDYSSIGMVDLRGRDNYQCGLREEYSCEQGYHARCPYKGTVRCEASQAEMRAAASRLVITNYAKWIHARKFGMGLSHIQRVIFDEGHEMFNALARAMQITLTAHEVEEVLEFPFPKQEEALFFEAWKTWAAGAKIKCDDMLGKMRIRIADSRDPKPGWVRHTTHLRNLSRRLGILATASTNNWIVDEIPKGYQFDPIQPGRYAEGYLLLNVPDITVMSATLSPKTLYMVGIAREAFDFQEYPSDFDPKRCPTYYVPTMRVDSKTTDFSMLWMRLDQVGAPRKDRNGLVQTVSFARQSDAIAGSRILREAQLGGRLFYNQKGEPATEMIENFVEGYPGALLVSPSVGQGFDFKAKAAEWQFLCKLPFPPPSKVLKARTEADKEYPYHLTMQKVVQMVGRIMRGKTDQGETVLADDHCQWFFKQYWYMAPKWFKGFVKQVDVVPPPPPRLV